jgi:hypothetical protein
MRYVRRRNFVETPDGSRNKPLASDGDTFSIEAIVASLVESWCFSVVSP